MYNKGWILIAIITQQWYKIFYDQNLHEFPTIMNIIIKSCLNKNIMNYVDLRFMQYEWYMLTTVTSTVAYRTYFNQVMLLDVLLLQF